MSRISFSVKASLMRFLEHLLQLGLDAQGISVKHHSAHCARECLAAIRGPLLEHRVGDGIARVTTFAHSLAKVLPLAAEQSLKLTAKL